MPRPVVHPRLFERIGPRFYSAVCSIQAKPTDGSDLNSLGDPSAATDFTTVLGLESINCYVAQIGSKRGDEVRDPESTFATRNHWIYLTGYFPQIQEPMQIVVTGKKGTQTYDILGVHSDSQSASTRVEAQLIV